MFFLLLLILPGVRTYGTPPSIPPRSYQLPYNTVQFVQHKPAKKGPILFPNDAPPPPPTPLIVTSRPLSESIAKSELNSNNSLTAQSQYHQVSYRPEYLARANNYEPFAYALSTENPLYDFGAADLAHADTTEKVQGNQPNNFYKDYEKRLMESIHPRRNSTQRPHLLWDRPIERKRFEQSEERINARKAFPEDNIKSKRIKVWHDSLYSREANYNNGDNVHEHDNNDGDDKNMDFDFEKVINYRRKISNRSEALDHHYGRRNTIGRQYTRSNNHSTKTFEVDNKYGKRKRWYSGENLSENDEKNSGIRDDFRLPTRTTHNRLRQYSLASIRSRPVHSIEKESKTHNKLRSRGFFHSVDDAKKTKYSNGKAWHRLIDNEEPLLRRRPSFSLENRMEDKIEDKMEDKMEVKSENIDLPTNNPMQSISPRNEEIRHMKPIYNSGSREKPQRLVKPLHEFNNVHKPHKTAAKADRIKYQESPEQFYYPANEGEHDNSKEYNHGENYAFSYTVKDHKTGDDFSHSQQSTGTATNGEYRVRLPDGRMQIVSYTADENGYKADVRYDERHNQDNSIDVNNEPKASKENRYRNNDLPAKFKHNTANVYNDHVINHDSFENEEYIRHHYKDDKTLQQSVLSKRPTSYNNNRPVNDFGNKNDFHNYDEFPTKTTYEDAMKARVNEQISDGLTDNNNEYLEHYNEKLIESNDKIGRTKHDDYFRYSDEVPLSKEVMDYSSELDYQRHQPHKRKFSSFDANQNEQVKVKPSYDELKNHFGDSRRNAALLVVSTVRPDYAVTPVNVVEITPKKPNLYTNIKNIVPVTAPPFIYSTLAPSTPRSYLLSTIANLQHQINLANKPVLSPQYINKINKYLTYK